MNFIPTGYTCPSQILLRLVIPYGTMRKEYKISICVLLVASAIIAVCYAVYPKTEHRTALQEGAVIQLPEPDPLPSEQVESAVIQLPEPVPLRGERVEKAKAIARSDEMVNAILQVVGESEIEVFGTPSDTIATLRCGSDEWTVRVMVDLEDQNIISVSLDPVSLDSSWPEEHPMCLVQIGEMKVPHIEVGEPFMRVIQRGEEGEIVFVTEKGTFTIRVDFKEGKVIGLEREFERRPFWPIGIICAVVIVTIVGVVLYKRKSKSKAEKEPEGAREEPRSPPQ